MFAFSTIYRFFFVVAGLWILLFIGTETALGQLGDPFEGWPKSPYRQDDSDDRYDSEQQREMLRNPDELGRSANDGETSESESPEDQSSERPNTIGMLPRTQPSFAPAAESQSGSTYSGNYRVGDKDFYYNEDSGQFIPIIRSVDEMNSRSSPSPDDSRVGTKSPQSTVSKFTPAAKPLVTLVPGSMASCQGWQHYLVKQKSFSSLLDCEQDLAQQVDRALEKLDQEREVLSRGLRVSHVDVPGFVRKSMVVDRPLLRQMIESFGRLGCQCFRQAILK